MRSEEEIIEKEREMYAYMFTHADDGKAWAFHEALSWVLSGTQWRDAKKELPRCDCKVLVYDELGMISDAWFLIAQNEFVHDGICSRYVYWMPLPSPPEGV